MEQEIKDVTLKFGEAFNRGDIAAAVEFYTDDAKFLHPGAEIVSGKQEIKEFLEAGRAFGLRKLNFISVEIEYDGNLAYERGIIHMEMEAEGKLVTDKGKYLVVMKRQSDGSWKVAIDIWNSDLLQPTEN